MADLFAKYNCTYCQEDIAGLRVKCTNCPDFELCLQCFSLGAEIGQHKNEHSYQFMDSGTMGVFTGRGTWSAREEMRLLDAIEQYGFGNWEDISKHIETRLSDEAKEEYVARYLEGNIGRLTWPAAASSRPTLTDTTCPDEGPLSPNLTSRLPPLDASPEEAALLGYMPQRDDFEREFDNEAEALVSPLHVNPAEDEDIDIAHKLAHVDMYTRRLRERARRKRLSRDFQLVSQYFAGNRKEKVPGKKKVTKDERELQEQMVKFTQFYTAQEHEQFVQDLVRQRDLAMRVRELSRYRSNGLTRHEECQHFEHQRLQREHRREKRSPSSTLRERSDDEFSSSERRSTSRPRSPRRRLDSTGEGAEESGEEPPPELKLLSAREKQLCCSLKLQAGKFLTLKAAMLQELLDRGSASGQDLLPPSSPKLFEQVMQYIVSSGWIRSGSG